MDRTSTARRASIDARILAAARALFVRHGFYGVTLDDVAAAAGLSRPTVASRYSAPEDLFVCLMQAFCEQRCAQMRARTASCATREALAQSLAEHWLTLTRDEVAWLSLSFEFYAFARRHPRLERRLRDQREMLWGHLGRCIAECYSAAGLRLDVAPTELARMCYALGAGFALDAAGFGANMPREVARELLTTLLLRQQPPTPL